MPRSDLCIIGIVIGNAEIFHLMAAFHPEEVVAVQAADALHCLVEGCKPFLLVSVDHFPLILHMLSKICI